MIPNLLQGQISGRNTVVRGAGDHLLARRFIPKNERSEQRTGMWIEVALLLPLFFLLGQNLPSILDRKSSNFLPPESEPAFSIVTNNYKGCHVICSVAHPILVSQNLFFFSIIVLTNLLMFGTLEEAGHVCCSAAASLLA